MPEQKITINLRVALDERGIVIMVQSDHNWAPVHGRNEEFNFLGVPCVSFKTTLQSKVNEGTGREHRVLLNRGDPVLFDGPAINATFLQAKNINAGATFVIPPSVTQPMGQEKIEDFQRRLAAWADDLYRCFLKSIRTKIVVTVTEYEVA